MRVDEKWSSWMFVKSAEGWTTLVFVHPEGGSSEGRNVRRPWARIGVRIECVVCGQWGVGEELTSLNSCVPSGNTVYWRRTDVNHGHRGPFLPLALLYEGVPLNMQG